MKSRLMGVALSFFLFTTSLAVAQQEDANSGAQFIIHREIEPQVPVSRQVVFVVDRSGSMHGDHFSRALNYMSKYFREPTDDLYISMLAFNDSYVGWPGYDGRDDEVDPGYEVRGGTTAVPAGWARLPSKFAAERAQQWLEDMGAGGDTLIVPVLRQALRTGIDNKEELRRAFGRDYDELSIVLVTDGLFGRERTDDVVNLINSLQREREEAGLRRAVLYGYLLGPKQTIFEAMIKTGPGGYVREEILLNESR